MCLHVMLAIMQSSLGGEIDFLTKSQNITFKTRLTAKHQIFQMSRCAECEKKSEHYLGRRQQTQSYRLSGERASEIASPPCSMKGKQRVFTVSGVYDQLIG